MSLDKAKNANNPAESERQLQVSHILLHPLQHPAISIGSMTKRVARKSQPATVINSRTMQLDFLICKHLRATQTARAGKK